MSDGDGLSRLVTACFVGATGLSQARHRVATMRCRSVTWQHWRGCAVKTRSVSTVRTVRSADVFVRIGTRATQLVMQLAQGIVGGHAKQSSAAPQAGSGFVAQRQRRPGHLPLCLGTGRPTSVIETRVGADTAERVRRSAVMAIARHGVASDRKSPSCISQPPFPRGI